MPRAGEVESIKMVKGLVSVTIPTKNSARTLGICLSSVDAQTYQNLEVIVVDALSRDETAEISRRAGARVISQSSTMPEARNIGLGAASGEFVLALDADMRLAPRVIEECVSAISSDADLIVIPEVSEGTNVWGKALAFNRNLSLNVQTIGERGIPRFFRHSDLAQIGGWDSELLWGEDLDVQLRLEAAGRRKGAINTQLFHSEGSPGLGDIYQKWRTYWATFEAFNRKHPGFATEAYASVISREYFTPSGARSIVASPLIATLGLAVRLVRALAIYQVGAGTFLRDGIPRPPE